MVTSVGGGYKEKYLQALDDQERQEKQFALQMEYLKKVITYTGAAAQGLDKSVDASLINLRDKMRGASGSQVVEQIDRVKRAVEDFERARDSENALAAKKLSALIDNLLELKIPPSLKDQLESFSANLKSKMSSYRNYPVVIGEFEGLHRMALEEASNPPQSFWQRLKSGITLKSKNEDLVSDKEESDKDKDKEKDEIHEEREVDNREDVDLGVSDSKDEETSGGYNSGVQSSPSAINPSVNDGDEGYRQVAQRISDTLQDLVNRIEPNEVIRHKVEIVQSRLHSGMDWFSLAVTLEDIRDILMQRYLDVDKEFSDYLKRVSLELESISDALGLAVERESDTTKAANAFSDVVSAEVQKMRKSVEVNENINVLKQDVSDHLSAIQLALKDYQQSQSSGNSLSEQLQSLVDRVQLVEKESLKTKELLEEERHKATHDVLTSLPNREAYNERAFHELQRFRRYCRPLTLAVCDIDFFKKINDTYGHQAGDKVLKLIAKVIATRLRKVDFVARYGGEEFVVIMPETTADKAFSVLDSVRDAIGSTPFRFKDSPVQITISFGISEFQAEDTVEDVFARADKALYSAKEQGRNCCIIADAPKD